MPEQKTYIVLGNEYTMRDPAAYGTDALVQEARKRYYLVKNPEDRYIPRQLFRAKYSEWIEEIEDTATDDVIVVSAILDPVGNAPTLNPAEMLMHPHWELNLDDVLTSFREARAQAFRDFTKAKQSGESTGTEATTPEATVTETPTAETTAPITESTSQ